MAGAIGAALARPFSAIAADAYPSRPIEFWVPYAPGGASDIIVRSLAPFLQKELGASIVVVNRAGANTAIAGAALSHTRNDGYTIMLADVALLLNSAVRDRSPGYDVEKDFTHVSLIGSAPLVLFVPGSGSKTLSEFLAQGKQKGVNIANAGPGSLGHLAAELLQLRTNTKIVSVPYRGSGLAINETMAGQVDATFTSTASGMPLVKSERLRALAIASPTPSREFPEIPTFEQLGVKGVNALNWWGVIGPAGMSPEVVDRIGKALKTVIDLPEMRERFASLGITQSLRPTKEFSALIKSDLAQWHSVVQEAKIKVD
jgi:tripartite-type tricarboxylate transporter receptor subunit TctC